MMAQLDFKAEADAMRDQLIARRRDLHRHPELAFEELRTAAIVAETLDELGLEVQTGVGKTGVVGILEGAADGPTVLYRADMDALPIEEANDVEYASTTPGVMHACGHDGHVTIGLGVAQLLSQHRDKIAGRVKFVFQPGEEGAGGAKAMVDDGVLNDPAPDIVLGMHLWNEAPLGKVGVAEGSIMAGSAKLHIVVKGRGGHGAMPHAAIDPVACAAQLITALHTMVGRRFDALNDPVVLSVTSVQSSSDAFNVIPQAVELRGTLRIMNMETSEKLESYIRETCSSVCSAAGCEADVDITYITIPVVNHADVVKQVRRVCSELIGVDSLDTGIRTMAAEDVSFLMADKPSMYVFVGSSNEDKGLSYAHHHPKFDFDEDALPLSVALMSAAVAGYVMDHGE